MKVALAIAIRGGHLPGADERGPGAHPAALGGGRLATRGGHPLGADKLGPGARSAAPGLSIFSKVRLAFYLATVLEIMALS